ncbi:MAG TPA: thioredoxin-dependent thiol peroxidase [Micrococcaceae bacterium]|nr:thioredoxin-dependent thiol peroxidase [Micrococcaceae bacterium]
MSTRLVPGQSAPSFVLPAADGSTVSLAALRGTRTVLYFYPAAGTPGCTQEACDFRDSLARLAAAGFAVVGVSPDPADKLARFAADEALTFPLLADTDHAVAEAFGAWGEKTNYGRSYEGLIRSTIVLDAEGTVELAQYNVRAKGHVAKLARDLGLG